MIAGLVTTALGLATLLLAVPVAVLLLQVLAACLPGRSRPPGGARPALVVLVPAHNEAGGIAATLRNLRQQLRPGDRLLVVADNCSDDTAAIARAEGAEVAERQHASERGKGFALAFGVDRLRAQPPAQLLIVDADCLLTPGALDALAAACAQHDAPVQALYLMEGGAERGLRGRVAEFAWRVKNQVRPRGGALLGWPCQLMGTGMAFPWPLIAEARLASGSIVEDMQLGIELAQAGRPPRFCEGARVVSRFPDTAAATASQRTRWEHGHLGMIGAHVPGLLAGAGRRGDWRLAAMALDLAVPPLALLVMLVMLVVLAWAVAGGAGLAGGGWWAWYAASAVTVGLVAAVLLAWAGWGRDLLRAWDLLGVPWYVLSKLGVYARFWSHRQKDWVRTERSPGDKAD